MGEYEKYSWNKITDTSLSAYAKVVLYSEGLEKMNNNPNVPQLFRDIFKGAFLPFKDPETLKLFLDQINEIEYTHSEDLGDAYEYLLSVMGSQGDAGQFRTPRHIIDFIVEVVDPKKEDKILDPACGTAGFLISAYKHILKHNTTKDSKILGDALSPMDRRNLTRNFVGYDISHEMRRLSLVNMYLHQFPDPQIYEYDTLTSTDHWDEDFDCILANPPFMTPKGGIRPHNRFAIQANRAEVLFVDYIMEHLSTTGKAGVIVPEGIIFQSSNAYKNLRKLLVEDNYLWGVISLPAGVFQPYSGVKTSVLLLDKNIAKKTENILFVNVESDGFDLSTNRKENGNNDLPSILESLKKYKEWVLNDEEVKEDELFNTNIVGKSRIKESGDYNLSGNRYQSSGRGLYVEGKWETVLLGDLLEDVKYTHKIKKSEYLPEGKYPIIDQSSNFIAGYCDNKDFLYNVTKPVVIFGDHTRELKYVDFDFVLGADGVKILQFKEVALAKYLFYVLKNTPIKSLGYSRHFKELVRLEIPLPPIEEQKKIVEELDRYQRIIDGARMVIDNWKPEIEVGDVT
jgi:type I restriction enzyme M protein